MQEDPSPSVGLGQELSPSGGLGQELGPSGGLGQEDYHTNYYLMYKYLPPYYLPWDLPVIILVSNTLTFVLSYLTILLLIPDTYICIIIRLAFLALFICYFATLNFLVRDKNWVVSSSALLSIVVFYLLVGVYFTRKIWGWLGRLLIRSCGWLGRHLLIRSCKKIIDGCKKIIDG
jgi:hypothetical protein